MTSQRQPHAPTDLESRKHKGLKIERLLRLDHLKGDLRLLEIGTGSGGISSYFGCHSSSKFIVESVDVNDLRLTKEGYRFHLIKDTTLPFPNNSFDIVISNHVIEHVGDGRAQLQHLHEIRRVLKNDGIGYLAVPNRWMLIEPHYRLIFLSWLPRKLRSGYLKLSGRGNFYDCEPLEAGELEKMLQHAELHGENLCAEALVETLKIERPSNHLTKLVEKIPTSFIRLFSPIIPTLIYNIRRS